MHANSRETSRADLSRATIGSQSDVVFSVALAGADFVTNSDAFWGTLLADQAHFYLTSLYAMNTWLDDLPVVERLGDNEFLAFDGRTSAISIDGPSVDTTWEGTIAHCAPEDGSPAPFYKCAASCTSNQHHLTLTPR